jgi:hypothetical protein
LKSSWHIIVPRFPTSITDYQRGANLAEYRYAQFLTQANKNAYNMTYHPGTATPYSGIYRCTKCGREDTSVTGHPLPPQNHHQHSPAQGAIVWQLIVAHGTIRE